MQSFNAEAMTAGRFADAVENAFAASRRAIVARALLTGIVILLVFSCVVGVLWFGAHDVLTGQMSGGQLSQFVLYAVLGASSSLGQLSRSLAARSSPPRAPPAASANCSPCGRRSSRPSRPSRCRRTPRGAVAFDNVVFAYPSRGEDRALHNHQPSPSRPGETVAIVGPSGAGKTTLFQLMMRFYDPKHWPHPLRRNRHPHA